jgi:hypothetical protein
MLSRKLRDDISKIEGIIKLQMKRDCIHAVIDYKNIDRIKKDLEGLGLRVTHENPFYKMILIE